MMESIDVVTMPNSSVLKIYSQRSFIRIDPDYQRDGDIWNKDKKQLLIDSIINSFDLPKIYFHEHETRINLENGRQIKYSVIDGRQRLEAIWGFIDNRFTLSNDFVYLKNPTVKAGGLSYTELAQKYPELKIEFDGFTLPIMLVRTNETELIEEMFSRLNEAAPLNAAEKRNALGGPMTKMINNLIMHPFFKKYIKVNNKRHKHKELAVQFLYLAYFSTIRDTKKMFLDDFVKHFKEKSKSKHLENKAKEIFDVCEIILDRMVNVFIEGDPLLKSQSICIIYFLLFKYEYYNVFSLDLSRDEILEFNEVRQANRLHLAEDGMFESNILLWEFDRMSVQGTNDASSIKYRLAIIIHYIIYGNVLNGNNFNETKDKLNFTRIGLEN